MRAVLVGIAGAAGALSRYGIAVGIGPELFPWATLGINLSGSFVLGFVHARMSALRPRIRCMPSTYA